MTCHDFSKRCQISRNLLEPKDWGEKKRRESKSEGTSRGNYKRTAVRSEGAVTSVPYERRRLGYVLSCKVLSFFSSSTVHQISSLQKNFLHNFSLIFDSTRKCDYSIFFILSFHCDRDNNASERTRRAKVQNFVFCYSFCCGTFFSKCKELQSSILQHFFGYNKTKLSLTKSLNSFHCKK